jgi:O-antigen ligase
VYEWKTWVALLEWLTRACLVVLAVEAFSAAEPDWEVPKWIPLFSVAVSVLALLHWYTSPGLILWTIPNPYAVRVPFPLLNHAQYATLIELLLAPVIIGAISSVTNARLWGWTAALMIASVFAVGSRAGMVIVTLETIAVMVLAARQPVFSSRRRRMAGLAIPTLLLIFAFGWQGLRERWAHPSRDDLRVFFAKSTIEMIQSRPLTGFGLGTWATVYPAFEKIDPGLYVDHAHSDWLEWAAEGGLPFVTLLLTVFVWSTYRAIQRPEYLGVVAVFLHAAVDFPLHKPILAALQFAILGILWHATRGKMPNRWCTIQYAVKK